MLIYNSIGYIYCNVDFNVLFMLFQKNNKNFYKIKSSIQLNGKLIDLTSPTVMGILNVTPDSFYDGGSYTKEYSILARAGQIVKDGGSFIDIGAMSTRPGALEISIDEELKRLVPAVKGVRKEFPNANISIDTYRSEVVKIVFEENGGFIVNDISGGTFDPKMFETVAELQLPYILMHTIGKSYSMQDNPVYGDIVKEVVMFLSEQLLKLRLLGVCDIIIDPGFGFGKTAVHNFEMLNRLDAFKLFELPILAGLSRKSLIWKELGIVPVESLNGTTVLNTLALMGGCNILRVHDVKEAVETIRLVNKTKYFAND